MNQQRKTHPTVCQPFDDSYYSFRSHSDVTSMIMLAIDISRPRASQMFHWAAKHWLYFQPSSGWHTLEYSGRIHS